MSLDAPPVLVAVLNSVVWDLRAWALEGHPLLSHRGQHTLKKWIEISGPPVFCIDDKLCGQWFFGAQECQASVGLGGDFVDSCVEMKMNLELKRRPLENPRQALDRST